MNIIYHSDRTDTFQWSKSVNFMSIRTEAYLCLNVLVLLIQELQIRVDEIKVIFGSDVVVATKSLQKLLTVDSYTQVHQNNVTNNVLPLGFWYQCVLQEMNTNKNLVHRLLALIVQSFHKFSSKTVTLYSMICFIKLL